MLLVCFVKDRKLKCRVFVQVLIHLRELERIVHLKLPLSQLRIIIQFVYFDWIFLFLFPWSLINFLVFIVVSLLNNLVFSLIVKELNGFHVLVGLDDPIEQRIDDKVVTA